MSRKDTRTLEEQEAEMHQRYIERREARLEEPLTRREVLEAIETVKARYSPFHHSTILELLSHLAKALS